MHVLVAVFRRLHLLSHVFLNQKQANSLKGHSGGSTYFLQLAHRTKSAMLRMTRTIMERNAASGCSEIAQPKRSGLIGAMIVVPTGRQIKC